MSAHEPAMSEQAELAYLRRSFAQHSVASFGRSDPQDDSPLYAALAQAAARDDDILRLTLGANTLPQRPHLLFAAVHYLLLSGAADKGDDLAGNAHDLAQFYADLTPTPRSPAEAYPAFRAFCLAHAVAIRPLITTYGVQNNEVGRCADLLLAFAEVARRSGGGPLAMIELGASAGLTMLWDRYGYQYGDYSDLGDADSIGDRDAPVQLHPALLGEYTPPLPQTIPAVSWRIGVDLHPLDVRDDEAARWLRALIWPEHADRAARMERALAMARQQPPALLRILKGDAVDLLPIVARQAPADATLCIYHSYAMNQTPAPTRARIFAQVAVLAQTRAVYRVSEEWYRDMPQAELEIIEYREGVAWRTRLAACESHGRWLRWLAPAEQAEIQGERAE